MTTARLKSIGRGIYRANKFGEYIWQYNCGTIREAEQEVINLTSRKSSKGITRHE